MWLQRVNKTEANTRTYILARPKSMILILFVTLLTQRMFSGWNLLQKKRKKLMKLTDKYLGMFQLNVTTIFMQDYVTFKSRCRMYILCMCCRPSQICLMNTTASSSIKV